MVWVVLVELVEADVDVDSALLTRDDTEVLDDDLDLDDDVEERVVAVLGVVSEVGVGVGESDVEVEGAVLLEEESDDAYDDEALSLEDVEEAPVGLLELVDGVMPTVPSTGASVASDPFDAELFELRLTLLHASERIVVRRSFAVVVNKMGSGVVRFTACAASAMLNVMRAEFAAIRSPYERSSLPRMMPAAGAVTLINSPSGADFNCARGVPTSTLSPTSRNQPWKKPSIGESTSLAAGTKACGLVAVEEEDFDELFGTQWLDHMGSEVMPSSTDTLTPGTSSAMIGNLCAATGADEASPTASI